MARFIRWPLETPMFEFVPNASGASSGGRGSQYGMGSGRQGSGFTPGSGGSWRMTRPWQEAFDRNGKRVEEFFTELDAVGGLSGLPFGNGILGDGRHGALNISSNTVATAEIPIYQLSTMNVQSGSTWTAKADNPGGFMIAVQGRCTIAGTMDLDGRGGLGGDGGGAGDGMNGQAGIGLSGSGGGGGAGDASAAGEGGGHGGPIKAGHSSALADFSRLRTGTDNWFGDSSVTSHTQVDIRRYAGAAYAVLGGRAGLAGGGASSAGSNWATTVLGARSFALSFMMQREQMLSYGAGGGSGGADNTDSGSAPGAGGNGGGFLYILCDELNFTGTINARGIAGANAVVAGAGKAGAGGGGGGGFVMVGYRTLVANTGTINVGGGAAGTSSLGGDANGSAGGAGFSKVFDMRV